MKTISLLGSTGSIGKSALDVISKNPKLFKINSLCANSDIKTLISQIYRFKPKYVAVFDEAKRREIKKILPKSVKLLSSGVQGLVDIVKYSDSDITIAAITGSVGLLPILAAAQKNKRVCVANKEPMVMAGELIMNSAKKNKAEVIPIDSEPSAIFQSLKGFDTSNVKKFILTASGGPFYNYTGDFSNITPKMAIKHPKWKMGPKISVDSATLMNKGLEAIEIRNLFGVDISSIEVLIHPQSIVHSAVEFVDGSVIAQMSNPDMRIPIQYSLTYPDRINSSVKKLSLTDVSRLDFYKPDEKKFKALSLARESAKKGGVYPTILNASNEKAVQMFLSGMIKFTDIVNAVEFVLESWSGKNTSPDIADITEADDWARRKTEDFLKSKRS